MSRFNSKNYPFRIKIAPRIKKYMLRSNYGFGKTSKKYRAKIYKK